MKKLEKSNGDKTQTVTKLKNQIGTKLKNSNCDDSYSDSSDRDSIDSNN